MTSHARIGLCADMHTVRLLADAYSAGVPATRQAHDTQCFVSGSAKCTGRPSLPFEKAREVATSEKAFVLHRENVVLAVCVRFSRFGGFCTFLDALQTLWAHTVAKQVTLSERGYTTAVRSPRPEELITRTEFMF